MFVWCSKITISKKSIRSSLFPTIYECVKYGNQGIDLIYNDVRVKQCFVARMWIMVIEVTHESNMALLALLAAILDLSMTTTTILPLGACYIIMHKVFLLLRITLQWKGILSRGSRKMPNHHMLRKTG